MNVAIITTTDLHYDVTFSADICHLSSPPVQPANPHLTTIKTQEVDVPYGEQWYIIVSS
jgi:hypothetical protein